MKKETPSINKAWFGYIAWLHEIIIITKLLLKQTVESNSYEDECLEDQGKAGTQKPKKLSGK